MYHAKNFQDLQYHSNFGIIQNFYLFFSKKEVARVEPVNSDGGIHRIDASENYVPQKIPETMGKNDPNNEEFFDFDSVSRDQSEASINDTDNRWDEILGKNSDHLVSSFY